MGKHKIQYSCKCQSCKATGLYVGFAEGDGAAIVCCVCDGSGERHIEIEYEDFEGREHRNNVRRVYRCNPGIGISENEVLRLEDFGGMDYEAWLTENKFPPKSEDRAHTCPAWFYQSADYKKKPEWDECGFGAFSHCKHFSNKADCWNRWDREQ